MAAARTGAGTHRRPRRTLADNAKQAQVIAALERRLADREVAEALGRILPALADVRALLRDAEAAGFAPMTARVRFSTGLLLEAAGEYKAFERARLMALEVGDQPLVFPANSPGFSGWAHRLF